MRRRSVIAGASALAIALALTPAKPAVADSLLLGVGDSSGNAVVNPNAPLASSMATQISHGSATYFFDKPVKVGTLIGGQPVALLDGTANCIQITPDGVTANGGAANGAMINPFFPSGAGGVSAGPQGFEWMISQTGGNGSLNGGVMPYSDTVNVDPVFKGASINLGTEMSIVKSIRTAGLTVPNVWRVVDEWAVLHVVTTWPYATAPAPSACTNTSKNMNAYAGLIRKNVLPGFTVSSGMPTLTTCKTTKPAWADAQARSDCTYFNRPFKPFFGQGAEQRRRFMDEVFGYSRDYTEAWNDFFAAMLATGSSISDADFYGAVELGINVMGAYDMGWRGYGGAGQNSGIQQFAMLAGFAYQDVSGVYAKAQLIPGNARGQPFFPISAQIGSAAQNSGANHSIRHATIQTQHVGIARWCGGELFKLTNNPLYIDGQIDADYELNGTGSVQFCEILNICRLVNGPAGIDGSTALLNGGSFASSNQYAAPIAYMDQLATWSNVHSSVPTFSRWQTYYADQRTACTLAKWTCAPEEFSPLPGLTSTYLTAGTGQFSWDFSAAGHNTETITAWDIAYAFSSTGFEGGVQFIATSTQAATGTQTGLPNAYKIYVRMRRQSASGWGPYSYNFIHRTSGGTGNDTNVERLIVTTGGASSGAVVNTVQPKLFQPTYTLWWGPDYTECSSTIDITTKGTVLYAGLGAWTGAITGAFSYVWKRNTVAITGATASSYTLAAADQGTNITCTVTMGATSATSVSYAVPNTYIATSVYFNAAPYLTRAISTNQIANATGMAVAARIKLHSSITRRYIYNLPKFLLERTAAGPIRVTCSSAAATLWDTSTIDSSDPTNVVPYVWGTGDGWLNILSSFDGVNAVGQLYINDAAPVLTDVVSPTAGTINWGLAGTEGICGRFDGTILLDADVALIGFAPRFIDWSNVTNRRKVFDQYGNLISIGSDGSAIDGTALSDFFGGQQTAANWNAGTNQGTLPVATMHGAVT